MHGEVPTQPIKFPKYDLAMHELPDQIGDQEGELPFLRSPQQAKEGMTDGLRMNGNTESSEVRMYELEIFLNFLMMII